MAKDKPDDKNAAKDQAQDAADRRLKRTEPAPKKKNWLLRMVLLALLFFASTVALGYFAFRLLQKGTATAADLKTQRARRSDCDKRLTTVSDASKKCNVALTLCQKKSTDLDSDQKVSAKNLASMLKNLNSTKKELAALRKQRAETAKELAAFKDLTEKFRKMIDSGRLKVVVRNGRMVVKLPAGVLFASGSATLSRKGELALMEVAVVLRQLPGRKFMVVGHSDNRPMEGSRKSRFKNNWELSTARAVTVTKFLVEAKLKPKNLLAAGHGEHDPVSSNKSVKGRRENRRIEIVLLPDIKLFPMLRKK